MRMGEEYKQESKNPDDDERKVDPGTARNTEESQGIPLRQLYVSTVFMTGITSEWAMSMIEDKLETLKGPELGFSMEIIFKAWTRREKS